jgi:hypothetical protein
MRKITLKKQSKHVPIRDRCLNGISAGEFLISTSKIGGTVETEVFTGFLLKSLLEVAT